MFKDRKEAGKLIAQEIKKKNRPFDNLVVIALPREGVPVAFEITQKLKIPFDIFSVKKMGHLITQS
jgi:putative phosphoribosyl transferase